MENYTELQKLEFELEHISNDDIESIKKIYLRMKEFVKK